MNELKLAFQLEAKDYKKVLEKKDNEMQKLLFQKAKFEHQLNELELIIQKTMNEKSEKLTLEKKQMNQQIEQLHQQILEMQTQAMKQEKVIMEKQSHA